MEEEKVKGEKKNEQEEEEKRIVFTILKVEF